MKLIAADRKAVHTRVLLWLVEHKKGSATLAELGEFVYGPKGAKNKNVVNITRSLTTRGWAECDERDLAGKYIWIFDRVISVLPAGYVWADFLNSGAPGQAWGVHEMWARIRALEKALEPFAARGVEIRKTRGLPRERIMTRFRRRQLEMAADMLQPYIEGMTIYPWGHPRDRDRPWLKNRNAENTPTEQPEQSASS